MAYLLGNARIDERGRASGGAAGDQTGAEVRIQNWYSYPWNCVIRAKDSNVAEKMAYCMETLCRGNYVGYDQHQRTTLFSAMQAVGWNVKALNTKCETDCSAMVAVCANYAGVKVSKDIYTGNMVAAFRATGQFDILYDSKYLTSGAYLKRGDILLNTVHHTAIALTTGIYAGGSTSSNTSTSTPASATGTRGDYEVMKQWKNGSTEEPVYQDTRCTQKIGSLSPYESCSCFGKYNSVYGVLYKMDGSVHYKTGFVKYAGGIK